MNEGQTSDCRHCTVMHVHTKAIFCGMCRIPVKTQMSSDEAPDGLWQQSAQLAAVSLYGSFLGPSTRVISDSAAKETNNSLPHFQSFKPEGTTRSDV